MKRTLTAALGATLLVGAFALPAAADHSHVDTPSGCHETNVNGGPSDGRGEGDGGNGNGGWHNSADGHDRAVQAGAHEEGGC